MNTDFLKTLGNFSHGVGFQPHIDIFYTEVFKNFYKKLIYFFLSSLLRHPTGEHLGSGSSLDASSSSEEEGGGGGGSSSSSLAAPVTVGIVLVLILLGAGVVFFRRSKCCDVTAAVRKRQL